MRTGTVPPWLGLWHGYLTRPGPSSPTLCTSLRGHRANNPEPKHYEAAERVFRYLKGTQSERLRLVGGEDLVLRAYYTDSDYFCQDRQQGKSVTGYIFIMMLLGGGDSPIVVVVWSSKLQTAVSASTAVGRLRSTWHC